MVSHLDDSEEQQERFRAELDVMVEAIKYKALKRAPRSAAAPRAALSAAPKVAAAPSIATVQQPGQSSS